MSAVRSLVRLAALTLFTAGMFLALQVGLVPARLARRRGVRWRARAFRAWARGSARIIGMRLTMAGPLPRPPFFLVSNHLGYVDLLVLASRLECAFVAKADVARWPILGPLCRAANTIFIDRASKRDIPRVLEAVQRSLDAGVGVVVFPEATSSAGATVLPFRPSLLEAASRARLRVSHAAISYRTPPGCSPARLSVCWWGDMTFWRHCLRLLGLPRFEAFVTFGAESFREDDRKQLALKLRHAVERDFRPVA